MSTPEPLSPERLAEIRDLSVDSCSADAQYNPDVWELETARTDLLAEVDRLKAQVQLLGSHLQLDAVNAIDAVRDTACADREAGE